MPKNIPKKQTTYTASDARKNFYAILRDASATGQVYEVTQRSGETMVMMSKDEFEGWQETLEIMSDEKLMAKLRKSM